MSSGRKFCKLMEESPRLAEQFAIRVLRTNGLRIDGNAQISLKFARNPIGNKMWGLLDAMQKVADYRVIHYSEYKTETFGEDGYNFYPYLRKN